MKTIPSALLTHYKSGTTTLCACWKVALLDGTVLGFTDHDDDVVVAGITYIARGGFLPTDTESQSRLAVDNVEAAGFLDSDTILPSDLTSGKWDYATVTVFMVNWRDTTMGSDVLMHGKIGQVSQEESTFKAELRGLANAYEQSIGQIIQPTCRATLGDSRCTVNLAPYTVTGILSGVSSTGLVLSDFTRTEPGPVGGKAISGITRSTTPTVTCTAHGFSAGSVIYIAQVLGMAEINGQFYVVKAVTTNSFTLGIDTTNFTAYSSGGTATVQGDAGYFDYGKITMTSGASIGLSMEVKAYSPGTITLQMQLPFGVASGDSYTLVAGCGKRFKLDCVARFGNGINFRGEPFLPGLDKIMKAGTQ